MGEAYNWVVSICLKLKSESLEEKFLKL